MKNTFHQFNQVPLNHRLKLISLIFLSSFFTFAAIRAQQPQTPYNPCATFLSTSVCLNGTHSCDEAQARCSTGYCWATGVPSDNAGIPIGGLVENKVIEIGGTYNITIGVTFKNCVFRMLGDARINISPTGNAPITVSFDGCDLYGCSNMWQGIVVNTTNATGGLVFSFLNGTIEDAYFGLRLDENNATYTIDNNSFRNDYIGIGNVRQNGGALNAIVERNHFWQSATLAATSGSLADPNLSPMPDYPLYHAGIQYINTVSAVGVGNTVNTFECLRIGIETVGGRIQSLNNKFQTIGLYGVFTTTGAARVIGCQFLISGTIGIFATASELKVQTNIFNGDWSEGVHSEHNLNSELITINLNNQFTITTSKWYVGIYVQRPQAATGTHCLIDGNTFTVSSNPTAGLNCIQIEDYVNATDEMEVSWNSMSINSATGGVFGIWATMGQSEKLNVHDNTIHYGTHTNNHFVNYGMFIFGLSSQNLSSENLFRHNIISGISVDTAMHSTYCAFHIISIDETEFCDNFVDQTYMGMHFAGQNDVKLRSNHFANHTFGLRIKDGPDAKIGKQGMGKGNQWDLNPSACLEYAAQVKDGNPLNSEIVVTQDDVLPWLPNHNKIDPDPTPISTKWFYYLENGGTDDICITQLELSPERKLTPSEIEVISGGSILTGVYLWDLQRSAYTKLLIYPQLRPSGSPAATFFNNLNSSVLASLAQSSLQVRSALNLAPAYQSIIDTYHLSIDQGFNNLTTLDASVDHSNITNLTPSWFAQRAVLLQQIASSGLNEAALEGTRNQQMGLTLQNALAYNGSIITTQPYESSRRYLDELYIRKLLAQPITQGQYQQALGLAQQDESIAGAVVREANEYLAPCDLVQIRTEEMTAQNRQKEQAEQPAVTGNAFQVMPNPNNGRFEISLGLQTSGIFTIYDELGQKIVAQTIYPDMVNISFDLGRQPNGQYWVTLTDQSGQILGTTKIMIVH